MSGWQQCVVMYQQFVSVSADFCGLEGVGGFRTIGTNTNSYTAVCNLLPNNCQFMLWISDISHIFFPFIC